jgi:hypothetical protein
MCEAFITYAPVQVVMRRDGVARGGCPNGRVTPHVGEL